MPARVFPTLEARDFARGVIRLLMIFPASQFSTRYGAVRQRLGLLKQDLPLIVICPVAALIVVLLGWDLLLSRLHQERRELDRQALQQTATQAQTYARQLTHSIEAIDQIALFVKHSRETSDGLLRLEELNERGLMPPSALLFVAVFDRNGRLLTSTLGVDADADASPMPFFMGHRQAPTARLYIGKPIDDPFSGRRAIPFSRRIDGAGGSFGGVVLVSVALPHITAGFDESTLGPAGFFSVVGRDQSILATRTGGSPRTETAPLLTRMPDIQDRQGRMLLAGDSWFRDGNNRYVAWHAVDDYPLRAMAGMDQDMVLQPHMDMRAQLLRNASLATLAILAFALVAMALSIRLAWRKHQLHAVQATYRIATESGNDGFYIARPVHDAAGNVADFEIIDCNEPGANLLQRQRKELLGARVSSLFGNDDAVRLTQSLRQAMKEGFYENDIEIGNAGPLTMKWAHLRIKRPDHDLAVTLRDISNEKAHVAELERRSNEDALTGLPNRSWFDRYLPEAIAHAAQANTMLALLFIDLDGFKATNDTLGHAAGDELLRNAGRRLKLAVRPHDHVARIGGDEFAVIIEAIAQPDDASHVAERILQSFGESFRLSAGICSVGTSIGISIFPHHGSDADTLLHNADAAMYSVKSGSKRNYRFFDETFHEALRQRCEREQELREAVEHRDFEIHYQPRIDLISGRIASLEALVRWRHPRHGLLAPKDFIALAEDSDLIVKLGEIVIDSTFTQLAAWKQCGPTLVPVSINVSARQFREGDIAAFLATALERHNIDPALIEIELTESSMVNSDEKARQALAAIQRMGIRLLVDDFGAGYSSLPQLQRMDFDVLKVDGAFTAELEKSTRGNILFAAIITMAHALGMRVVAEGVETSGQISILKSLRCDEVQGYYISRPQPAANLQLPPSGFLAPA
jgi:diguanylate cyclase (GGDEF)-like protein